LTIGKYIKLSLLFLMNKAFIAIHQCKNMLIDDSDGLVFFTLNKNPNVYFCLCLYLSIFLIHMEETANNLLNIKTTDLELDLYFFLQ
jgi:hypothetical protein